MALTLSDDPTPAEALTNRQILSLRTADAVFKDWAGGEDSSLSRGEFEKRILSCVGAHAAKPFATGWRALCDSKAGSESCTREQFKAWFDLGSAARWQWFDVTETRARELASVSELWDALVDEGESAADQDTFETLIDVLRQGMPEQVDRTLKYEPKVTGKDM
jgi:hypothetical protein